MTRPLQDAKLLDIERQFEEELATLNSEFKEERKEIEEKHAANRDELMSVIVTINDEETEKFADLKQQYDTEMEECRSRNVEAVNALAASLDNVIEVCAAWW